MNSIEGLTQQIQELTDLSAVQIGTIETLTREKLEAEQRAFELSEKLAAMPHVPQPTFGVGPCKGLNCGATEAQPVAETYLHTIQMGRGRPDDPPSKSMVCVRMLCDDIPAGTKLYTTPPAQPVTADASAPESNKEQKEGEK